MVSLPSIVFNNIFHTDPSTVDPNGPTEVSANFDDLSAVVSECIQAGYDAALARVDQIIADGGYDYELSMEALVNNALVSADYDTCYALAAYSASMGQRGTTKADLQSKLNAVADQMYRVTYEVKEAQVPAESGEDTDEAGRAAIRNRKRSRKWRRWNMSSAPPSLRPVRDPGRLRSGCGRHL